MRLLILGTGLMASRHAEAFNAIDGISVDGCCDVRTDVAAEFARKHGLKRVFTGLDSAIESGGFDALVNTTPDAVHFQTTMTALRAGLHVFCEKPLATRAEDAQAMTEQAISSGLVNGVNLTYRNVSAVQAARSIVAAGTLGELRHFEASYLQSWLTQPAWGDWTTESAWLWRLSSAHGSTGVLGDVGIHILDFLTFAASLEVSGLGARLTTFHKAEGDRIGDYALDANDSVTMNVTLENGASGVVHASRFASGHLNDLSLKLFGTKGGLRITNNGPFGTLEICEGDDLLTATWRPVELAPVTTNYQRFADALLGKAAMTPDFARATRLQQVIDLAFLSDASRDWRQVPETSQIV